MLIYFLIASANERSIVSMFALESTLPQISIHSSVTVYTFTAMT